MVTHWEPRTPHDHRTHSDEFRQAHVGERPAYLLGGEFQTCDVRISTGPDGKKGLSARFSQVISISRMSVRH